MDRTTSNAARPINWGLSALFVLLVLATVASVGWAQQKAFVLDLTKGVTSLDEALGVPAAGITGIQPSPNFQLPLAATIIDVKRQKGLGFVLELKLRNTGSTTFELPIGRPVNSVLKHGSRGRRSLLMSVSTQLPTGEKRQLALESVAASMIDTSSVFALKPRQQVTVLLPIHLDSVGKETPQLLLQAEITELHLADEEYRISATSGAVRSPSFRCPVPN